MTRKIFAIITVWVISAFMTVVFGDQKIAYAQTLIDSGSTPSISSTVPEAGLPGASKKVSPDDIVGWNIDLERMEKALDREGIRDQDFEQLHADALKIQNDAAKLPVEIEPDLKLLRERFAQLGPAPAKDQPAESPEIAEKRKNLAKTIAEADGKLKAAQLVIVKARQIRNRIVEARRARFVKSVTSKSYSLFDPKLWGPFQKDVSFYGKGLGILAVNIVTAISNNLQANSYGVLAIFSTIAVLIIVLVLVWRAVMKLWTGIRRIETERSLRAINALLYIVSYGVIPAVFLLGLLAIGNGFDLFSPNHSVFLNGAIFAIAFALVVRTIAHSFLQPTNPTLRVAELSDLAARKVMLVISAAIIVSVLSLLIYSAARAMVASYEFGIVISAVFALLIAGLAGLALRLINLDQREYDIHPLGGGMSILLNWSVVKAAIAVGIIIIILSLLTGYIALADFTANQIIISSSILALLWLVLKVIDDNLVGCFQTNHHINQKISNYLGWKHRFTEQIGVVIIGLLRMSVILITIVGLLVPWGFRARDWADWISAAFFGFQVGDITISFAVILSAIVVFLIGVVITRSIRRWLSVRFLPTTRLDAGIQNSISTVFGYVGLTIAAAVTVSYAGFDLTSLAFVAGALSVGIGFGLQSVVSNFVSGLILLVERPIKAGDWVVTSGGEGTVRKISVRSTEIETFDRSTVVLPNSTLITESVVNWNHKSSMGRIKLAIGVGYDSDPERVREIMLECANSHGGILDTPAPVVYFMEFGASSLDFELRCYLADVGNGMSVRSELRYALFAALNKEGISIPFPQQDVHIKGVENITGNQPLQPNKPARKSVTKRRSENQKNIKDGAQAAEAGNNAAPDGD